MIAGSPGRERWGLVTRLGRARLSLTRLARAAAVLLLIGIGLMLDGQTVLAATLTVTTTATDDPGSLGAAITAAAAGDTIQFAPGVTGTIRLRRTNIDKRLTIKGPGAATLKLEPYFEETVLLEVLSTGRLSLDGLTLQGSSTTYGGALRCSGGALTVENSLLRDGSAFLGGGIYADRCAVEIVNSTLTGNSGGLGGGILVRGGGVSVTGSTFEANSAFRGGGISGVEGATVIVTGSTFAGNSSDGEGGGIYVDARSALSIANSTFSGNTARSNATTPDNTSMGGAIYAAASASIIQSTLSGNSAVNGGGGLYIGTGTGRVRNTIIVDSPIGGNCAGTIVSDGNNLSDTTDCFSQNLQRGDIISISPGLAPLAFNSPGRTKTHALRSKSPAVDGVLFGTTDCGPGTLAATDQRGVQRPQTRTAPRCDIGAYELEASGVPTISEIGAQQGFEDRPLAAIAFTVADDDTSAGSLTVTAESSNPALFPNGSVVVTGTDGSRTAALTPAANQSGEARITLTVTDSNARSATAQFTVTVLPVNDAPTFTPGLDLLATSGAQVSQPWATGMSAGPPNESTQSVTFAVTTDQATMFTAQPAIDRKGTLTFTSAAGASGDATVTVQLKDDGGTANGGVDASASQKFRITMVAANQPPQAKDDSYKTTTGSVLKVAAPGVLDNDTDPEGKTLTSFKVKDPAHGSLTFNADGSFEYTPAAGFSGSDSFTYKANDGTADSEVMKVTVTVAALTPQSCVSRPNPNISTQHVGPGRLQVTVTAQTNAGMPSNALTRLEFGAARNARIEVPGTPGSAPGGFDLTLPANTQQTTFFVQRSAPGEFKIELVVVDGCHTSGPFKTFIGGGAGVQ